MEILKNLIFKKFQRSVKAAEAAAANHTWNNNIKVISLFKSLITLQGFFWGGGGLIVKVSSSQPLDRGFEPHTGHTHESWYDTSTG